MALAIMAVLGTGVVNLVIVFTVTGWVQYARTLRAEILHIKEQDFVKASRALGAYPASIIMRPRREILMHGHLRHLQRWHY